MNLGFAAGEVMVITGARDGDPDRMIGRLVEIAESKVRTCKARLRSDRAFVLDVPMQLVCKPRVKNRDDNQVPLGAYPLCWMRPYLDRGEARRLDTTAIKDPTHKWLVVDPEGAVMC